MESCISLKEGKGSRVKLFIIITSEAVICDGKCIEEKCLRKMCTFYYYTSFSCHSL